MPRSRALSKGNKIAEGDNFTKRNAGSSDARKFPDHLHGPPSSADEYPSLLRNVKTIKWAAETVLQDNAFVKLPAELREYIFEMLFSLLTYVNPRVRFAPSSIAPYVRGRKFIGGPLSLYGLLDLSRVCRQFFIDIVGGSLIYKFGSIRLPILLFPPTSIVHVNTCLFFSIIPPFHKDCIRRLEVDIHTPNLDSINEYLHKPASEVMRLKGLRYLIIHFILASQAIDDDRPERGNYQKEMLKAITQWNLWASLESLISLDISVGELHEYFGGINRGTVIQAGDSQELVEFQEAMRNLLLPGRKNIQKE